jgi:hypothetical protein
MFGLFLFTKSVVFLRCVLQVNIPVYFTGLLFVINIFIIYRAYFSNPPIWCYNIDKRLLNNLWIKRLILRVYLIVLIIFHENKNYSPSFIILLACIKGLLTGILIAICLFSHTDASFLISIFKFLGFCLFFSLTTFVFLQLNCVKYKEHKKQLAIYLSGEQFHIHLKSWVKNRYGR